MVWREQNRVDFVFGLARNKRLEQEICVELVNAEEEALRREGRRAREVWLFAVASAARGPGHSRALRLALPCVLHLNRQRAAMVDLGKTSVPSVGADGQGRCKADLTKQEEARN